MHHHPLKPAFHERSHCICDICEHHDNDKESKHIAWYCEECDFDVCLSCIHRPPPKNYSRKDNGIATSFGDEELFANNAAASLFGNDAKDDEFDDCDENENQAQPEFVVSNNFEHTTIERNIAAHWEAPNDNVKTNETLLGGGYVDQDLESPSPTTAPFDITPIPISVDNDGNLSEEAKNALYILEQPSLDVKIRAAADITLSEEIVRRISPSIGTNISSYKILLNCISAGKLGHAGSLLLSNAYAPTCLPCSSTENDQNGNDSENVTEETVCCVCAEGINGYNAPDGAVGCLGGHAMHPACAADLLLGGGKCPTCRQTLFHSKVAESEIREAAQFVQDEIERVKLEEEEKIKGELNELAKQGLSMKYDVGDVVLLPTSEDHCKLTQCQDPAAGWWHDDMASCCGLQGVVTDVITGEDNNAISIRVKTKGGHEYDLIRRVDGFCCEECRSNPVGLRYCKHCMKCEICCRRSDNECSKQSHEWYWNPSLVTLIRRGNSTSSSLTLLDESEPCKAEKLVLRLKGELIAIKSAREAIKESTEKLMSFQDNLKMPGKMKRQLSKKSNDAVTAMVNSGIAPSDWQRARHLLMLAQQWGDSDEAKLKRSELYTAVEEGNLDSVARIVRRLNAERIMEAARWANATSDTNQYIVESFASADLRVFPRTDSPRSGFKLKPNTEFSSLQEVSDRDGNMWIKIDPKSIPTENLNSQPLQGWVRIRPGGDKCPPIVKRENNCLRCFGCGDNLIQSVPLQEKYERVQLDNVKEGDVVFVSATLEKVKVKSVEEKNIRCTFEVERPEDNSNEDSILYRPCDLLMPKLGRKGDGFDETLLVNGRMRSRRELVLDNYGNEEQARIEWYMAKKDQFDEQEFASCARGHLLHARCFQQALFAGSRCPAPGCMEQLFLPTVSRLRTNDDDDTCCGENNQRNIEQAKALHTASEFTGQTVPDARAITENNTLTEVFNNQTLKMCPMCCSGPLFNQECSDMNAHHGQCSMRALKGKDKTPCSPDGDFRVSASDIAARMTQVSSTKSVADLLPRCKTHKCLVMFNGCMNCGHLFNDADWNDMPDWDPKARAYLELGKKRRNAARLLTDQIRSEAALLQFERDAYYEAGDNKDVKDVAIGWSGSALDEQIEPPPKQDSKDIGDEVFKTMFLISS